MDRTPSKQPVSPPTLGAAAPAFVPAGVLMAAPSLAAAHLWAVVSSLADDAGKATIKAAALVGATPALGSVNTVRRAIDDAAAAGLLAVDALTGNGQRVTLFMLCKAECPDLGTLRKLGKHDRPTLGTLDTGADRPTLGTPSTQVWHDRPTLGTPTAQTWAPGTPKLGHSLARAQDTESFSDQQRDIRRRQGSAGAHEDAAVVAQGSLGGWKASVYRWALDAGVPASAAHGGALTSANTVPDACERAILRAVRRAPDVELTPARIGHVLREAAPPSLHRVQRAKRDMLKAAGVTVAVDELCTTYSYGEIRANVRHVVKLAGSKPVNPAHVVSAVRANDAAYDFGARVEAFQRALLDRREGRRPRKLSAAAVAAQRAQQVAAQVKADQQRRDALRAVRARVEALKPEQMRELRAVVAGRDKRFAALPVQQQTARMLAEFVIEHLADLEDIERGARRVVPV